MKLLLDQGLPASTVNALTALGIESRHVSELGLSKAEDSYLLSVAFEENFVMVTLDADFHALLALGGLTKPSVIRIRIEGLKGHDLAEILHSVINQWEDEIAQGAAISVTVDAIRIHRLPL